MVGPEYGPMLGMGLPKALLCGMCNPIPMPHPPTFLSRKFAAFKAGHFAEATANKALHSLNHIITTDSLMLNTSAVITVI